ncbi:MAG: glycosyltransferase family 4 protein [Patescibacteria group bacterium]
MIAQKAIDIYNPHDWLGLWVAANLKRARIVALINDVPERHKNSLGERIKLAIDRAAAQKIAYLLVLDEQNRGEAIAWSQIAPPKVLVVRSGIDVKKYEAFRKKYDLKRMFNLEPNSLVLICANLLLKHRRYEDVIYALARLKDLSRPVHLIILAKQDFCPDYAAYLHKITDELGLNEKVHFIDKFVSDEERMAYIAGSDLLVFPNSPQTWGLTAIEAMALGVPVVVSTGAGVSEVLHDGVDAIIYPDRDVAELTHKLSLYLKNPEKLKKIGQKGKAYILATFSWEKFGDEVARAMEQSLIPPQRL